MYKNAKEILTFKLFGCFCAKEDIQKVLNELCKLIESKKKTYQYTYTSKYYDILADEENDIIQVRER